ncbi:MAG: TIGR03621 family F420-dependent LLM class oxidoreductase [Actinomycetota bacterium]
MPHPRKFRFGVQVANASSRKDWLEKVRKIEDLGYTSVVMPDHFTEQLGPVPALVSAAENSNLRVGTLVLDNDYKHPVVLAKELATIDLLSEGRLELGIGAGWMRSDYDQSGMTYDPPAVRVDRFEEGLAVLKETFADGPFSFEGKHYSITNYEGHPKPVQKPHPPILIGAGGKRMLSIAAREAGIVGINPNLAPGEVNAEVGRDGTAERADRKLAWVREAAGDRFDDIELNTLIYVGVLTDDRLAAAANFAPMFGLSAEEALDVPNALVGTVDQMSADLEKRRERWSLSYYVVGEGVMEDLAPLVERMTGR